MRDIASSFVSCGRDVHSSSSCFISNSTFRNLADNSPFLAASTDCAVGALSVGLASEEPAEEGTAGRAAGRLAASVPRAAASLNAAAAALPGPTLGTAGLGRTALARGPAGSGWLLATWSIFRLRASCGGGTLGAAGLKGGRTAALACGNAAGPLAPSQLALARRAVLAVDGAAYSGARGLAPPRGRYMPAKQLPRLSCAFAALAA
mmetsp:Transcript_118093/g.329223  ORF Transcript_118093/g.329223 Transcript_118093/m.329223 type:complete len:206 (+) Transcript_118093:999-1616(+)